MQISHAPLTDQTIQAELFSQLATIDPVAVGLNEWKTQTYLDEFTSWLMSSSCNQIIGLDQYPNRAYCSGVISAIESFILRHARHRRLRFSRAEFIGAKITCNYASAEWSWLEDGPICAGDAIIISWPFAGNGGEYPGQDELFNSCEQLDVPVMVDLAYFGISSGMIFDLTHSCITDVSTSLSKPMSAMSRLGIRYTKDLYDDNVQENSNLKIYNRISTSAGTTLMQKFSHDWIVNKYLPRAHDVCKSKNLTLSNTFTLALGDKNVYPEFERNGYNRICITDEIL